MIQDKPQNPHPKILRWWLKKILPPQIYIRHIGRHEEGSLCLWRHFAQRVPSGGSILDIGAFRGEYSLEAKKLNPEARVFAFEIEPNNLKTLNSLKRSKAFEIIPFAVAENDGRGHFMCNGAMSKMIGGGESEQKQDGRIIDVPTVSLDSWVCKRLVHPALIKIDVEGSESGILRGAKQILNEYQPVIICEVLTNSAGSEVMRALPPCYQYWDIDENSGVIRRAVVTRRRWRDKNWLLIPESKAGESRVFPKKFGEL